MESSRHGWGDRGLPRGRAAVPALALTPSGPATHCVQWPISGPAQLSRRLGPRGPSSRHPLLPTPPTPRPSRSFQPESIRGGRDSRGQKVQVTEVQATCPSSGPLPAPSSPLASTASPGRRSTARGGQEGRGSGKWALLVPAAWGSPRLCLSVPIAAGLSPAPVLRVPCPTCPPVAPDRLVYGGQRSVRGRGVSRTPRARCGPRGRSRSPTSLSPATGSVFWWLVQGLPQPCPAGLPEGGSGAGRVPTVHPAPGTALAAAGALSE